MVPLRYNLRSLVVRKATTIATAGGIALTVFVFAAALMLGDGVQRAMVTTGQAENVILLRQGSETEMSSVLGNDYKTLGDRPQVAPGGAIGELVVVLTVEAADESGKIANLIVRGTPAEGVAFRPEVKIVSGRAPTPGTNEVMVGQAISGRFKRISPGESFEVRRNRPLQVVGEFATSGSSYESEVWGDLDVLRKYLGRESDVSSVRVRLVDPSQFDAYRSSVESDKSLGVKAMREADYYRKQSGQTSQVLSGMGILIAFLVGVAAAIGAAITMNGAIANRSNEIGTLRALGFSRASILMSFMFEAVALSVVGGIIGISLVTLLTLVQFPVVNVQTFSEIVIDFRAQPGIIIGALIFSAVIGLVGGLLPALRASRVSPIEALRA